MTERFKILKSEYKLNYKLALIASLITSICLFLFFPHIAPPAPPPAEYQTLLFTINDLAPNSTQKNVANSKPQAPKIFVPDLTDEPEVLPDAEIVTAKTKATAGGNNNSTATGNGSTLDLPQLPYVPRQILEVLPKNVDENTKGYVEIKLKIGTDGKVLEYRIIANTISSHQCLEKVVAAAYKSRWEPVKIDNNKIVYWVNKTYNFN